MLRDELVALLANRSVCPAARPTASRPRTLATSREVRSPNAKSTVTKAASSDEPNGPFSEAAFVTTLRLFTEWDIQACFGLVGETGPERGAGRRLASCRIAREVFAVLLVSDTERWFGFQTEFLGAHAGSFIRCSFLLVRPICFFHRQMRPSSGSRASPTNPKSKRRQMRMEAFSSRSVCAITLSTSPEPAAISRSARAIAAPWPRFSCSGNVR